MSGAIKFSPTEDLEINETMMKRDKKDQGEIKIQISDVSKLFRTSKGTIEALQSNNLEIKRGEFCVIVGPSGCGKTTLLRTLADLETATSGKIHINRENDERPLTSMVFQEQSIFPWMTVRKNVEYGLKNRGIPRKERDEISSNWIEKVGLSRFKDAYPHQLSGGMKQRVSIARAFANDPEVLLMDEPFSALDEQNKTILQQELLRICEETKKTVVFITHSIDEAIILGDRIFVMTAAPGRIKHEFKVPFSRPREVLKMRANPLYGELQEKIWEQIHDEVQKARELEVKKK
ncbi:ABC transporter ATP-binding protein [Bacillus sp. 1P02SD]|uniref:ABC transporter ATP-binding protein n=1 Tax=Bacillus sp. 1P02SD TaxID=3132264 RepID=UPI00399F120D